MSKQLVAIWVGLLPCALAQIWDGTLLEKDVRPGEMHRYRLSATAGQFVQVTAAQLAGDIVLKLTLPDGKLFTELDRLRYEGVEEIAMLAPVTGDYVVEVRDGDANRPARYRLEAARRVPADQDRSRATAFLHSWVEARRLRSQQTAVAYREALTHYEKALPEWRSAGSLHGEVFTLVEMGWVLDRLSDHRKAKDLLEQALALHPVPEERYTRAVILAALAEMHTSIGENRRAIEFYQQSLAIRRAAGDRQGEAIALTGIGSAYMNLSDFARAIEVLEQALALRREAKDIRGEGVTHSNLAGSFYSAGNLQQALNHYSEARRLFALAGDRSSEAVGSMGIGRTYYGLGDYRRALEVLKTAEATFRQSGDRAALGTALSLIGSTQIFLTGHDAALPYLEESLALYKQTGRSGSQAIALVALCRSLLATSRWDRAMETATEGAKLAQASGSKASLGSCLSCQGRVELARGNYDKALELLNEALDLSRQTGARDNEAVALIGLARAERARGNPAAAIGHMEQSTALLESMRQQVNRPELRASYRAARADRLDLHTAILMDMHQREPQGSYSEGAFNLTEQWRARSLAEMLAQSRTELREELTEDQRQREDQLLQQVNQIQRELFRDKVAPARQKELQQKLLTAEQAFDTFQTELKRGGSRYASAQYAEAFDAQRIQRELLDGETVLLEYALGDSQSYGWAVTAAGLTHAILPPREQIERQIEAYRKLLGQPASALTASTALARLDAVGKPIYEAVVAPFEKAIAGRARLVIVPDGLLSYLPFEALPGGKRLIERFSITYVPSASSLAALRKRQMSRPVPERALLAFADPSAPGSGPVSPELAGYRERGFSFGALPNARVEVASIQALFPSSSTVYVGAEAREDALRTEKLDAYRYVHFAAHGYFDEQHPSRSGIVLASNRTADSDGVLQAPEVMRLRLNADLVTLSACESGLGKLLDGEGVLGLTRAFLYAGAQSTVVSLWKVNDAATADLMKRFYGNIKGGMARDQALREAKLALVRTGGAWRHPYYWAPLVFTGDGGPSRSHRRGP